MRVAIADRLDSLRDQCARWDALAGACPFRSWDWVETWARHYIEGDHHPSGRRCFLCAVYDDVGGDEALQAVLPAYLRNLGTRGRVLGLIGDGEVCSDRIGLICNPAVADEATSLIADLLVEHAGEWDCMKLDGIPDGDTLTRALVDALVERGCGLSVREGPSLWTIALPDSWEEFLAMQSKSHRKQLRRCCRDVIDCGKARWRLPEHEQEHDFSYAWETLVDLHQRRRQSLGEPGCFASEAYTSFHEEIARIFFDKDALRLSWVELDGEPVAAEYHFAADHTTYAYQGGLEPDKITQEPGRLSMIACVQQAIEEGKTAFDLLRGDEPYKAHWRAEPEATHGYEIVSPRASARWRYRAWSSLRAAHRWVWRRENERVLNKVNN